MVMIDTPLNILPGCEQYEVVKSSLGGRRCVRYDYRDTDGELYHCIAPTLQSCQSRRDIWLRNKQIDAILAREA